MVRSGNADANSFRTGLELSRETTMTNWDITLIYAKNESDGVETQHNALLYSIHDWSLALPRWSLNTKTGLEYDEFKNFDIRYYVNTGLGYCSLTHPFRNSAAGLALVCHGSSVVTTRTGFRRPCSAWTLPTR